MNIYITNVCNQRCPYCYAEGMMSKDVKKMFMTFGDFKKVLNFFKRSEYPHCRFEGGEPTIHPQFVKFLNYAIGQGFMIQLFTNGLFNDRVLAALRKAGKRVYYTWNINNPDFYSKDRWRLIQRNLKSISPLRTSVLGINIYREDQKYEFIYDLLKKYRIDRLRLCFAHRGEIDRGIECMSTVGSKKAIPRLARFMRSMGKKGIRCYFDCGFLPCQWRYDDIGFFIAHGFHLGICEPCPGITTDLKVVHCFQTSDLSHARPLSKFKSVDDIYRYLEDYFDRYKDVFFFKKCPTCSINAMGVCSLGCLTERKALEKRRRAGASKAGH
jgi:MoaA/NifB/PqqE/SkfB family radical SAM enzyme